MTVGEPVVVVVNPLVLQPLMVSHVVAQEAVVGTAPGAEAEVGGGQLTVQLEAVMEEHEPVVVVVETAPGAMLAYCQRECCSV